MAFKSIVDLKLKPDTLDQARKALGGILNETRAFDGCLRVEVLIDESDPSHWTMVEDWASAEHSAAYSAWRAGEGKTVGLGPFLAAPPVPTKYTVDDSI